MATTLTKELLVNKAKPVYREVDVKGFGRVGIRQRSELKRLRRTNQLFDDLGNRVQIHHDRRRAYLLIDQLMIDENTPMFSESDLDSIMDLGSEHFDPLIVAINQFNEELEKNELGESDDSSNN